MTRDDIVSLFERRQKDFERLDVAALVADHAPDGTMESPMAGVVTGRAAIEEVYRTWIRAFRDLKVETVQLLIDGDNIAQVGTIAGSDTGGFMGLPPSGRALRFPIVMLFTMRGDKIDRLRTVYDFTGVLVQLGVLKARPS